MIHFLQYYNFRWLTPKFFFLFFFLGSSRSINITKKCLFLFKLQCIPSFYRVSYRIKYSVCFSNPVYNRILVLHFCLSTGLLSFYFFNIIFTPELWYYSIVIFVTAIFFCSTSHAFSSRLFHSSFVFHLRWTLIYDAYHLVIIGKCHAILLL